MLLDTTTGRLVPAPTTAWPAEPEIQLPVMVLDSGDLLIGFPEAGNTVTLQVISTATGEVDRAFTLDAAPALGPDEAVVVRDASDPKGILSSWMTLGAGELALVPILVPEEHHGFREVAVLLVSLADGAVVERIDGPSEAERLAWRPGGLDQGSVLAVYSRAGSSDLQLAVHRAAGGAGELASRVDASGSMILRGESSLLLDPTTLG